MCDPDWPPYVTSPHDHYHALGVIAAEFNHLEHALLGLFLLYLGFNDPIAIVFQKIRDNSLRIDLVRKGVARAGETADIKDGITRFCDGFDRCAQNRNILMHSGIGTLFEGGVPTKSIFSKAKSDRPLGWNRFLLDKRTLREIADDTHHFQRYGHQIINHVIGRYRRDEFTGPFRIPDDGGPLPGKPPLPMLLTPQQSPNPKDEPPPPRS